MRRVGTPSRAKSNSTRSAAVATRTTRTTLQERMLQLRLDHFEAGRAPARQTTEERLLWVVDQMAFDLIQIHWRLEEILAELRAKRK
jgi:hypothetical protein